MVFCFKTGNFRYSVSKSLPFLGMLASNEENFGNIGIPLPHWPGLPFLRGTNFKLGLIKYSD